jgi:S1-C subfamily serine protease
MTSVAEVPVDGEGVEWLIHVARHATEFFAATRDPKIAESVGKPETSGRPARLTIKDFIDYLGMKSGQNEWGRAMRIMRVLHSMHGSMMLLEDGFAGGTLFGRVYVTADLTTNSQRGSHLYLSRVLGAALIIPTFAAITIPIPGINHETKVPDIGSGIVLSDQYILTNRHVVVDMQVDNEIPTPRNVPPGVKDWAEMAPTVRVVDSKPHSDEHLDVAIIEVEPHEGTRGLNRLAGLAFRDPVWGDETYVLGYPPVPTSDDAYLAVQQGTVVDPAHPGGQRSQSFTAQHGEVVAPSVGSYMADTQYFYYSAVTRPGNSGGPIVAQDGRVVGIVAHSAYDKGRDEACFYRGIPTREIVRALTDLFGSTIPITLEDWSYSAVQSIEF